MALDTSTQQTSTHRETDGIMRAVAARIRGRRRARGARVTTATASKSHDHHRTEIAAATALKWQDHARTASWCKNKCAIINNAFWVHVMNEERAARPADRIVHQRKKTLDQPR